MGPMTIYYIGIIGVLAMALVFLAGAYLEQRRVIRKLVKRLITADGEIYSLECMLAKRTQGSRDT
jgi:hypothetical protein